MQFSDCPYEHVYSSFPVHELFFSHYVIANNTSWPQEGLFKLSLSHGRICGHAVCILSRSLTPGMDEVSSSQYSLLVPDVEDLHNNGVVE